MKKLPICLLTLIACLWCAQSTLAQTRPRANSKTSAGTVSPSQKTLPGDLLPRKIDNETAVSPLYSINSKYCRKKDSMASEGEDFYRECQAYGDYLLRAAGSDYRINYGIIPKKAGGNFLVMFFPLEEGAAAKYERADLYDEKLGDEIEWRLDEKGVPFAAIIRAAFYKNTGSAKTFANPKNKAAEFIFVRGLAGYEDLKEDVPTSGTAYNPLEQARMIAATYLEKHRK